MAPHQESKRRSIATRTGDDGTTALLFGRRVAKDHPVIEAVGALDELNAALGLAKAAQPAGSDRSGTERIQRELIALMGEVAAGRDTARYLKSKLSRIDEPALVRLDAEVAAIEGRHPSFEGWATPGADLHSAALEVARTSVRRAERRLVALRKQRYQIRPLLLRYLNRLSDLLWLRAREAEGGKKQ